MRSEVGGLGKEANSASPVVRCKVGGLGKEAHPSSTGLLGVPSWCVLSLMCCSHGKNVFSL